MDFRLSQETCREKLIIIGPCFAFCSEGFGTNPILFPWHQMKRAEGIAPGQRKLRDQHPLCISRVSKVRLKRFPRDLTHVGLIAGTKSDARRTDPGQNHLAMITGREEIP